MVWTFWTVMQLVVALCLIGVVVAAAQKWLALPEPFGWVKGLLIFIFVCCACFFLWTYFVGGTDSRGPVFEHPSRR